MRRFLCMVLPSIVALGGLAALALTLDRPRATCDRALAQSRDAEPSAAVLERLRRAAEADAPHCQNALGMRHWYGEGVPEDDVAAARWFGRAARLGLAQGQRNLGYAYLRGLGVTRDPVAAEHWLGKAAAQGDAVADYQLGEMFAAGGANIRDAVKAARHYIRAAERGYAPAQRELGDLYRLGRGVPLDLALAESWLRKATAQDDPDARFLLAVVLRGEDRRQTNCAEAGQLMQEAAERGFVQAQRELGFMTQNGWCVPGDVKQGAKWLRSAAERNDDIAQYLLAQALRNGIGVPVNRTEATQWLERAATQGYEPALRALADKKAAPLPVQTKPKAKPKTKIKAPAPAKGGKTRGKSK